MRNLSSGCLALIVFAVALVVGTGGGCFIGGSMAPYSRDWMAQLPWAANGGLIGAAVGLIVGLVVAFAIVRKRPNPSEEDGP